MLDIVTQLSSAAPAPLATPPLGSAANWYIIVIEIRRQDYGERENARSHLEFVAAQSSSEEHLRLCLFFLFACFPVRMCAGVLS